MRISKKTDSMLWSKNLSLFTIFYVKEKICSLADFEVRPIHSEHVVIVIVPVESNCLGILLELF